jgi:DNA-binding transcriptional MerR regulator
VSSGAPATAGAVPGRAFMSIGEVLGQLRPDFADITISKIRFLEAEGLVEPERTASGYRKFSREDLSRLRYVLTAQRDHYLPLRVIKEHLDAIDRGLEPPALSAAGPKVPRALVAAEGLPGPEAFLPELSEIRLSRKELLDAAGLTPEQLDQLEQYGLLSARGGGSHYDGDALVVAKTVAEMGRFGIEARHLRPFKAAAEREIGLVEQVVTPLVRQRNPEARARAEEVARELAALSVKLHATLVRTGLGPGLRR